MKGFVYEQIKSNIKWLRDTFRPFKKMEQILHFPSKRIRHLAKISQPSEADSFRR